jgi:hypothetical protein
MRHVRRFLHLPSAERQLFGTALLLVVAVRLGLSTLPFRRVRQLVGRWSRVRAPQGRVMRPSPDQIARHIVAAARYVPAATCLTQGMSAQVLLARYGYKTELRIGVARRSSRGIDAHAWVEHDGRILVGGPAALVARFTPLPPLHEAPR